MEFKKNAHHRTRKGFTLVELLTVIGIIAILAGVLIPTIGNAIKRAVDTKSIANLREVGKAAQLYSLKHKGKALPAVTDIDMDGELDNWWQTMTYMIHGSTELASARSKREGLKPFEDPEWKNDPNYKSEDIGVAMNVTPGLPDIEDRNSDNNELNSREFRLSQIDFLSKRMLATIWNALEINGTSVTPKSFERSLFRYDDHVNVVFFDAHVDYFGSDEYEKFKLSIVDPFSLKLDE